MSNNVQIKEVGSQSDIRLINIRGLLDTVIAYHLQEKMDILIEDGIFKYIIDLEELEHISSAGIGLFSAMAMELQKLHGQIIFTHVPEQVLHLFEITRLIEIFTIRETINEAIKILESSNTQAI
jgi:anti-anti-sigma factor